MQALLLALDADLYALELTSVREVVAAPAATPVPGAPPELLGIFNLRGEVVPLFDLARLVGLHPGAAGDQVTVAETADGPVGLAAPGRPRRAELGGPAGPAELPGAVGRFAVEGSVATLVDVGRLLARRPR